MINELLRSSFLNVSARLTANHAGQILLNKTVALAQYLQGIGGAGEAESSGEKKVLEKLKATTDAGRPLCIFDGGANKGQWLRATHPCLKDRQFTIHCFEPGGSTYQVLCENARGLANVKLNHCGLGRVSEQRELYYDTAASGLASLTKRRVTHLGFEMKFSETVRIVTVDEYCGENGIDAIDLLKLDVEGHEMDVLRGCARMFANAAIRMVTFEFSGCDIDTRTFFQDFFYFFQERNMCIARITPRGYLYEIETYREILEQFRTTNFLCYRR